MKLSDVMSRMGLAGYAEVALVIFFFVFVWLTLEALFGDRGGVYDRAARMPLDDDESKGEDPS